MGNEITKIKNSVTRSISMENPTGEKGKGGMAVEGSNAQFATGLGQGFKISPCVFIEPGQEYVIANIQDMGQINHIWMTLDANQIANMKLKVFYDQYDKPSIDCPLSMFFAIPNSTKSFFDSKMISVNPGFGLNSFWPMPFKKGIKIVVLNNNPNPSVLYFQVDYELREVKEDEGYLHTFYQESKPLKEKENHIILPRIESKGHYVGTIINFETDFITWWGEGEIKFFMDGDTKFPTICGTGTEDYFLGAWNFEPTPGHYQKFNGLYAGLTEIIPDVPNMMAKQKFSMYRFHIMDPIRFEKDLRVEIQSIGWEIDYKHYRVQSNNISSLCLLYLNEVKGVN